MTRRSHIFGRHAAGYADVTEVVPGVFVDPGASVTVVDARGEVAHWTADEWAEDPEAVTACVNACILAAARGPESVRENIADGGATIRALVAATYHASRRPAPRGRPRRRPRIR